MQVARRKICALTIFFFKDISSSHFVCHLCCIPEPEDAAAADQKNSQQNGLLPQQQQQPNGHAGDAVSPKSPSKKEVTSGYESGSESKGSRPDSGNKGSPSKTGWCI